MAKNSYGWASPSTGQADQPPVPEPAEQNADQWRNRSTNTGRDMMATGDAQQGYPQPQMPDRSLPERNWNDYGGGQQYNYLGQQFNDRGRYNFNAQLPRDQQQFMPQPYNPQGQDQGQRIDLQRWYNGPMSQQLGNPPIREQNNYTGGRWNPEMGGDGYTGPYPQQAPQRVPQPPPPQQGAPVPRVPLGQGGARQPVPGPGGAGPINAMAMAGGEGQGRAQYGTRQGVQGVGTQAMASNGVPVGQGQGQGQMATGEQGAPPLPQFDMNQLLNLFGPNGYYNPQNLGQGDRAPEMQYYMNSLTPILNYLNQGQDRNLNMEQFNQNLQFQRDNALFGQGMDMRNFGLQQDAFRLGAQQFENQFNEGMRQFNQGLGEDRRQFDATNQYNYNRMYNEDAQNRDLARLQSETARRGQDMEGYGIRQRTGVDMRGQDLERYLGDRRFDNERYLGDRQYDTQRYGIDTEAQTARLRMENDLMQSRYATFGRAQAPNMRMVGGWR